ncbi:MAG: signal recognition particle-docking protein FtsY [Chloroflexi bacterium]|nr:signal recognition particle-docking protein FtsY [Chloroflexota bacterium]
MLGLANKYKTGLAKTRHSFFGRIVDLFRAQDITEETWDELEALLIQADVGVETTLDLINALRSRANERGVRSPEKLEELLKEQLVEMLQVNRRPYLDGERMLNVVMVVGVNGSGKTTSIAKLARYHKERGDRVLLAAADTFRAAAIDQLKVWGERAGVEVIAHQPGADPGAVVFDAIRASQARRVDVLIIDTAGRLHTKYNLMQELRKMVGVARKQVHQAPHETLLVLDATTGQNALSQARVFTEMVGVTGVLLAKLDSTAKGGMVFAIHKQLGLPIHFVGTGETLDDLQPFDPKAFVEGLFAEED